LTKSHRVVTSLVSLVPSYQPKLWASLWATQSCKPRSVARRTLACDASQNGTRQNQNERTYFSPEQARSVARTDRRNDRLWASFAVDSGRHKHETLPTARHAARHAAGHAVGISPWPCRQNSCDAPAMPSGTARPV
jgi:hypothetical protein